MARPFADVLRDLAAGQVYDDLTSSLGEIVTAVLETRKAGEMTLKIKVKPNGEGSVVVAAEMKNKVPEPAKGETLFFATSSGSLLRNDPRQAAFDLREVKPASSELKEAVNA